jgi:hypothetical protein
MYNLKKNVMSKKQKIFYRNIFNKEFYYTDEAQVTKKNDSLMKELLIFTGKDLLYRKDREKRRQVCLSRIIKIYILFTQLMMMGQDEAICKDIIAQRIDGLSKMILDIYATNPQQEPKSYNDQLEHDFENLKKYIRKSLKRSISFGFNTLELENFIINASLIGLQEIRDNETLNDFQGNLLENLQFSLWNAFISIGLNNKEIEEKFNKIWDQLYLKQGNRFREKSVMSQAGYQEIWRFFKRNILTVLIGVAALCVLLLLGDRAGIFDGETVARYIAFERWRKFITYPILVVASFLLISRTFNNYRVSNTEKEKTYINLEDEKQELVWNIFRQYKLQSAKIIACGLEPVSGAKTHVLTFFEDKTPDLLASIQPAQPAQPLHRKTKQTQLGVPAHPKTKQTKPAQPVHRKTQQTHHYTKQQETKNPANKTLPSPENHTKITPIELLNKGNTVTLPTGAVIKQVIHSSAGIKILAYFPRIVAQQIVSENQPMSAWLRKNDLRFGGNLTNRRNGKRIAYYPVLETPTSEAQKHQPQKTKEKEQHEKEKNYKVAGKIRFLGAQGKGEIRFFCHQGENNDKAACGIPEKGTGLLVFGNVSFLHT